MNKTLRTKSSNINIISFVMILGLFVFSLSGCQQVNDANGNKATNTNTATNSNTTANANANSNVTTNTNANSNTSANTNANSNVTTNSNANKPEGNSNKAETTKKEEMTNPSIVTAEQVNGTWGKGESWIKIKAIGDGKLNVNFSIFNERTTNSGQAEGVAKIDGIDATFSPEVDGGKCKFTMKFTGGKLIVKQIGSDLDCGFGAGVSADGTYTKK